MSSNQFSTFRVDGRLYGVNVKLVQEITKPMPITKVPLAPDFIHGLINLRGQIVTAIGVRELFELSKENSEKSINVVCKSDGLLLSLIADEIGDVLELEDKDFEELPETVSMGVSRFLSGVYKIPNEILSVVDIKKILEFLNK
ncbi:MAG: chemotaxis protein CheW [Bacteriovoracaceae bacterium]